MRMSNSRRNLCGMVGSRRISIFIVFIMLMWTYTFINYSMYKNSEPDIPESEQLRRDILDTSKKYVKALAKEQNLQGNLPEAHTSYDLKKTMAVLLDSILERLTKLEKRVDSAFANNSLSIRNISAQEQGANYSLAEEPPAWHPVQYIPVQGEEVAPDKDNQCGYTKSELEDYPHCTGKIAWMKNMWKSDVCYARYGVDGSQCSIHIYLSEVERWCPKLPGRENEETKLLAKNDATKATIQTDKEGLFHLLSEENPEKFEWMKLRISRMWDKKWMPAAQQLQAKYNMTNRIQKKILIHLGLLTKESGFKIAENAFSGGPLGELVQWSDIIASLYILGHNLKVSVSSSGLKSYLKSKGVISQNCPLTGERPLDLIYIDIVGLKQFKKASGPLWQQFSCMLRVIDTFGTEPAYNLDTYVKRHGTKSNWGKWNLVPRQFFTLFPHTPDNSFMGFVVENTKMDEESTHSANRGNTALVYGKRAYMWLDRSKYLNTIRGKYEIHATVSVNKSVPNEIKAVPSYVNNHGILSGEEVQKLLQKTKLFIGLGFPYEGPAPLEAIANGCIFLNPKFDPPKNSQNTKFFNGKPTQRELTSQHPYAENFIGKPHVWTVDVDNTDALEKALDEILEIDELKPHLPYEFTCEGMLQRLNVYVENQDFCTQPFSWPPKSAMQIRIAETGQSCKDRCRDDDLICEPGFFKYLNTKETLEREYGLTCQGVEAVEDIHAPSVRGAAKYCYLQVHDLLFSCAGGKPDVDRLCPCRDYIKEQVALCKNCVY
ncbi:alpha-1,6-mannosylglycoprotein 6-beta-N-acetylglucosaminyltransferase A-like isoform X2 [Amphiura filiformis]|uniref:alpha-1,6-mannosylglycoprotein 6-beta-N-acetylglucosaminyltransferase A-like isoform X2 n=1 Tax=Amphiura filiformis TaxID=82378 RepID=UPI003B2178AA